ncbi:MULTISPECIES: OsmC family protein [Sphingobacterium]|jgi:putative redox protein|uniref:OsmC family protein n=1 Tax=Sphingobacterium TaxID=28453 RepID=UPI000C0BEB70|nr:MULTISPECIES: OsmC family protein [Sphingobacterium]MCT1531289.1 OsmC family protein [Sphingobacterium daejeonense]
MAEVLVSIGEESYTTTISYDDLEILADEPIELGGQNKGLAPSQLLLSSVGACKAITMRMYANRKKWKVDKIDIKVSSEVQKSEQQQTTFIKCNIFIEGDLDEEQKRRIYAIGEKCPVHKMLMNPIVIESNLIDTMQVKNNS